MISFKTAFKSSYEFILWVKNFQNEVSKYFKVRNFIGISFLIFLFFLKFPWNKLWCSELYQALRVNQFSRLLLEESNPEQLLF